MKITGEKAEVHKILVSASAVHRKKQFSILQSGGGWVIGEQTPIGKELLAFFEKLQKKYGTSDMLPLWEEKGVYNFYLKKDSKKTVKDAKSDSRDDGAMDLDAVGAEASASSGGAAVSANSRHARTR